MNVADYQARIATAFDNYLDGGHQGHGSLVSDDIAGGKLYEAFVLAHVAGRLTADGYRLVLSVGSEVLLKGAAGPINPAYPYLKMFDGAKHVANVWTDVEFTALSCQRTGIKPSRPGHFHELDILVCDAEARRRPTPDQIWVGIECKHRKYGKSMLREILGVRRELSLLHSPLRSRLRSWPAMLVPAHPPSCLLVYSSSPKVTDYDGPGQTFGIQFHHLALV